MERRRYKSKDGKMAYYAVKRLKRQDVHLEARPFQGISPLAAHTCMHPRPWPAPQQDLATVFRSSA